MSDDNEGVPDPHVTGSPSRLDDIERMLKILMAKLNEPKVLTKSKPPKKKKRKIKIVAQRGRPKKVKIIKEDDDEIIDIEPPEPNEDEEAEDVIIDVEEGDDGGEHIQAHPVAIKTGKRPNRFEQFFATTKGLATDKDWKKQLKQDKEDKKLYKGLKPLARRPKPPKYRIACDGCGKKFVITEDLLKTAGGQRSYTCNRCVVGRK